MKIIRYSSMAFTPQKQTHHIRIFETWQNLNPKDYPGMEYIMQQLKQQHTLFYNNHIHLFFLANQRTRRAR